MGDSYNDLSWQHTSEVVVTSIVSILAYFPRPFDTDSCYCSDATGFVVDAERGLILTNRVGGSLSELIKNANSQ
jgi:hypothetical protein